MRLGIFGYYWRRAPTRASLVLAELAEEEGHTVSFFPRNEPDTGIGSRWDKDVLNSSYDSTTTLEQWAKDQDQIIFFTPASENVLKMCEKTGKTAYFVTKSAPSEYVRHTMPLYNAIIGQSPFSASAAEKLTEITGIAHSVWWTGWPQTLKTEAVPISEVLIPCYDKQGVSWPQDWLHHVAEVVFSHNGMRLSLLGPRGCLRPEDQHLVRKKLRKEPRFSMLPANTDQERMAAYSGADLVCYGLMGGEFCWSVLEAQSCGTTVLAWDSPSHGWFRSWPLVRTCRYAEAAIDHENIAYYCDQLDTMLDRKKAIPYSIEKHQEHYGTIETEFRKLWVSLFNFFDPKHTETPDGTD